MNLIQQGRYFLYFIKHNPAFRGPVAHKGFEAVRVTRKLKKKGSIKQVKAQGMRQNLLEPGTPIWAIKNVGLPAILFIRRLCGGVADWRACPPFLWRACSASCQE
jgi:hypothetical protein